ncbi:UNVERIFIED_CONTAM: hypothetical protein GTU68_016924, partial [Idotea baltica]|nr:hypothetical protein [Idotea baltica]
GGADQITVHLREDRRHIQDRDLRVLRETVNVKLNLECACVDEMLGIAIQTHPHQVCLVPEKREEVTTEGGLDIVGNLSKIQDAVARLQEAGIWVSLFIDPDAAQVEASKETGAQAVELHTGTYAHAAAAGNPEPALSPIVKAAQHASELDLTVDAGHGLTYTNVRPIVMIPQIAELNIGHSIISRAIFVGIQQAVREMKNLCQR